VHYKIDIVDNSSEVGLFGGLKRRRPSGGWSLIGSARGHSADRLAGFHRPRRKE